MTRFQRLGPTAQGVLLLLVSVMLLSCMDVMAKSAATRTHPIMAAWARFLGQTAIVFIILIPRMPRVLYSRYPGLQFLRALFLLAATTCFFFGLTQVGLANATALMNTAPVIITLGAALFLGERFGPRRAFGVTAALIGALIVIRPGTEVFTLGSLLPLGAALFVAGYSLITRSVGHGDDIWTSLLYTASFGALVLSAVVPFFWVAADLETWAILIGLGFFAALGHFCLIKAYTLAEASAIAPFTYAQLLFAILWGILLFGENPDGWTLLGATVIVSAGLYVWHRETRGAVAP